MDKKNKEHIIKILFDAGAIETICSDCGQRYIVKKQDSKCPHENLNYKMKG